VPRRAGCLLHALPFLMRKPECGVGILLASRARAGEMPAPLSGGSVKIEPPLSLSQTSRAFQKVGSDLSVGGLKR
jgi:hypothetical protein